MSPSPCGPSRPTGSPALPSATWSSAPSRSRSPRSTRVSPSSTPGAGASSGWGYETAHRAALAGHLAELTPLERANLVADTWATTLAGISSLEEFLALAAALGDEGEPAAWAPVGAALMLTRRVTQPDQQEDLQRAVRSLLGPTFRRLGFDAVAGENDRTPTLRALAINLMGTIGADPEVRAEAARRFDASPLGGGSGSPIPPDIESATLAVVSQLLREGDYEAILERYRHATTPQEEMRSLSALAGFPDVDLCLRTFDLAMTEVRSQDGFAVLGALMANSTGNQAVWTRLTENWDAALDRFPKNAPPRIAESVTFLCGDAEFAEKAIAFLDAHPLSSGPRRVAQAIERLRINVAFGSREQPGLVQTLRSVGTPAS